jgi:hypothetical protein
MPSLIGGFGKIKKQQYTILKSNSNNNKFGLGPYLAGLIEADGSFAIHDVNSKSKKYLPKIIIVFNLNDAPLAKKLIDITNVGKFYKKENQGCVI